VTAYTVQLANYEGPLDLLLHLIERAEMEITTVSLAAVTDQYLSYLENLSHWQMEDLASFVMLAARLLQIKSEALLPRPPLREPGEEDPAEALARQLILYRRFKQIASILRQREQVGLRTYLRLTTPPAIEFKPDLSGIDLDSIRAAMMEALAQAELEQPLDTVVAPPKIRLRDKIQLILQSLRSAGRANFNAILDKAKTRLEVVVSFLALLELIKLDQIEAVQQDLFSEIEVLPGPQWEADQELEIDLEFEE
jgi:segregation and condensation protein A